MHAYAADDPVFVAMNARFQRENAGPPGLCITCHAPVAKAEALSTDGKELASVPKWAKGVTCFACHTIESIEGDHNAQLTFGKDGRMRGPFADPIASTPHGSVRSDAFDSEHAASSAPCGTCHDVQNGHGLDVERTFAEWRSSVYATDDPKVRLTCAGCHLPGRIGKAAAVEGAPDRRIHDHSMPGVDVALTAWPERDAQRTAVQRALDGVLVAKLCVDPPQGTTKVTVTLDDAFAGHGFPSGALHDRRAWVELVAKSGADVVFASGVVPDGASITADASAWILRERLFDSNAAETMFLWNASSAKVEQLPPAVTADPKDPRFFHSVARSFDVPPQTDEITIRVRIVAVGLDVLDELVASSDLAADVRKAMPTFDLASTKLRWAKSDGGYRCVP